MDRFKEQLSALKQGLVSLEQVISFVDETVVAGSERPAELLGVLEEWQRESPADSEATRVIEQRIRQALPAEHPPRAQRSASPTAEPPSPRRKRSDPQPAVSIGEETVYAPIAARTVGVGDVVKDRFHLDQELGAGGMGKVFKARDRVWAEAEDRNPYVAVKVLSESFRRHPESFKALQRETEKARRLAHPNIVRVYDCDRDGDIIFMTMEYLSGRTVDGITKRPGFSGLPFKEVMEIVRPAGEALAFAHRSQLVHSDFKPSNVFLTDDGEVKVIDFGIARAVKRPDAGGAETTTFDVEKLGALTPKYASPEMFERLHGPDPRDDIFALACVTYELLTGKHPFGGTASDDAREQGLQPAQPPGLTRPQWHALKQALAFERKARTASVERFLDELSLTKPRLWRVLAIGSLAGTVVAVSALWYFRPGSPSLAERVEEQLAQVNCSILQARDDGGAVVVTGHAGKGVDVAAVEPSLSSIKGVEQVTVDVDRFPDTYCNVLDVLKRPVIANGTGDDPILIAVPRSAYREGDDLTFKVETLQTPSHIYVDLYMPDGYVQHLLPRPGFESNRFSNGAVAEFGRGGESGSWQIAAPFGTELVVVVSASQQLFDSMGWEVERTEDYLSALKTAFERLRGRPNESPIVADFQAITTTPN